MPTVSGRSILALLFASITVLFHPGIAVEAAPCDPSLAVRPIPTNWSYGRPPIDFHARVVVAYSLIDPTDFARTPLAGDDGWHHELIGFDRIVIVTTIHSVDGDEVVGRLATVRPLTSEPVPLTWDGVGPTGRPVPPGRYRIELRGRLVRSSEPLDHVDRPDDDADLGCAESIEIELTDSPIPTRAATCPSAPPDYWESALEVADDPVALRAVVNDVISAGHVPLPYSSGGTDTWDGLNDADENPSMPDELLSIYRNQAYPDGCSSGCTWNREHTWPKSYGFSSETGRGDPYTDLHALRTANPSYNGDRGNRFFDWCTSNCSTRFTEANGGFGGGSDDINRFDGSVWEVWPHRRGDVARSLLYMDVRYEGENNGRGTEVDLVLVDSRPSTGSPRHAYLSTLLEWHENDPPDDDELRRNDQVWCYQGNRNPFVDHPEWARCIFSSDCTPPIPGPVFDGIESASDLVPCQPSGIALAWSTPTDWNDDGCSPCDRSFRIERNREEITDGDCASPRDEFSTGCLDTTAPLDVVNDYRVVAVNHIGGVGGSIPRAAAGDFSSVTIAPTATPPAIRPGGMTTLDAGVTGGIPPYLFGWIIPPDTISNEVNPVVAPTETTTYEIVVFDSLFCESPLGTVEVWVVEEFTPRDETISGSAID